jgi:hypothetical protein
VSVQVVSSYVTPWLSNTCLISVISFVITLCIKYIHALATQSISTACFVSPSHQSVCMCIPPPQFFSKQQLGNYVRTTRTIDEWLDVSSLRSIPYKRRVYDFKREPSAQRYNCACLFLEDINTGTWPSRLGESQMRQ